MREGQSSKVRTYFKSMKIAFKDDFLKLPNILTQIRLIGSPVSGILLLCWPNDYHHRMMIAIVFALIASTDLFDGLIARVTNQTTEYGRLLDPVADTLFGMFTLIALSFISGRALFLTILLVMRQIHLAFIYRALRKKGLSMRVILSGKIKTASVSIFILMSILPREIVAGKIFDIVTAAAFVFTAISWLSYHREYDNIISQKDIESD